MKSLRVSLPGLMFLRSGMGLGGWGSGYKGVCLSAYSEGGRGMALPLKLTSSGTHQSGQYTSYWSAFLFYAKNCATKNCYKSYKSLGAEHFASSLTVYTRMHSSRMRTVCCSSLLLCLPRGVFASALGEGVSASGLGGICLWSGGVSARYPPCGQNS